MYSIVNPMLESMDELAHYGFIEHLAQGHGLPVQIEGVKTIYEQEGSQPPLYYALGALIISRIDTSPGAASLYRNPYSQIGVSVAQENRNILVHTAEENWPWRGVPLAVHVLRGYSIVLGALSICGMLRLGRLLFPAHPALALGGAALAAFNPMFLYLSASINNDNLVICLCTWGLVLGAQSVMAEPTRLHSAALGGLAGLAAITKVSGALLLPFALLALAVAHGLPWWQRSRHQRDGIHIDRATLMRWAGHLGIVIAIAAAMAAWWYGRNLSLYGELTGASTMAQVFGRRERIGTFLEVLGEIKGFRMSYWGIFGYFSVLLGPEWLYALPEALALAGTLGALRWALSPAARARWAEAHPTPDRFWAVALLLATWTAMLHLSLMRWTAMTYASQARLVFPALGAMAALTAWGLCNWIPPRRWRALLGTVGLVALLLAAVVPWAVIGPAYAPPRAISLEDIPASAAPFGTVYGEAIELTAYELGSSELAPGESTTVTLYWRVLAPVTEDYTVYLHLFGRDGELIAWRDSLAGMGARPTSLWVPGQIIEDRYRLAVVQHADAPVAARLNVGLYRGANMTNLPARDGMGRDVLQPTVALVKISGPGDPTPPSQPLDYALGDGVLLLGHDLSGTRVAPGGTLTVTLYWRSAPLAEDYTVFVHLVSADGLMAGQGDGPPLQGEYPTRYWGPGERLRDVHQLAVAPDAAEGEARVLVGLYGASGERLPVRLGGEIVGDSAEIARVIIAP